MKSTPQSTQVHDAAFNTPLELTPITTPKKPAPTIAPPVTPPTKPAFQPPSRPTPPVKPSPSPLPDLPHLPVVPTLPGESSAAIVIVQKLLEESDPNCAWCSKCQRRCAVVTGVKSHCCGAPVRTSQDTPFVIATASHGRPPKLARERASRYHGVQYLSKPKLWRAMLRRFGRSFYLGDYHTETDAALAWDNAMYYCSRALLVNRLPLNFPNHYSILTKVCPPEWPKTTLLIEKLKLLQEDREAEAQRRGDTRSERRSQINETLDYEMPLEITGKDYVAMRQAQKQQEREADRQLKKSI